MMYRLDLDITYPKTLKWLQSLFKYFDDDLVRSFSAVSFNSFKNKIKMIRRYNARYQSYLENGDYTNKHCFTHISCPVCTSQDCIHFDAEFLNIDLRDNTCQASDLHLYSSLTDEYEDEDTFRTTMYDIAIHVCGRECTPKLLNPKVRNLFNVYFRDIKAYHII